MSVTGILLDRRGYSGAGEAITSNAFFAALVLSMPFWLLKGQPWRAQAVLVIGLVAFLTAISYIATLLWTRWRGGFLVSFPLCFRPGD